MKTNLKTFPMLAGYESYDRCQKSLDEVAEWYKAFEKELRFIDFGKWFEDNKLLILEAFDLHSQDGLTPNEVLHYFVQKEVLGE